jgi:hypothetical protein
MFRPCHSEAGFTGEESAVCQQRKQQIPRAETARRNDKSLKIFQVVRLPDSPPSEELRAMKLEEKSSGHMLGEIG